jgi:hypothetical protein
MKLEQLAATSSPKPTKSPRLTKNAGNKKGAKAQAATNILDLSSLPDLGGYGISDPQLTYFEV